eukprot:CAMPEP_0197024688 /NCGR_PEP_ID=MMETSP1384-20130603/5193_1 /TAXON_ID=29189 /ORGANISM="Ammonia sp." /LENGTH=83 /DNA_ID=CAMNT_0042453109 /DNA_START=114 /DNA_END=365 /DNA_ORIENTATION=+
MNSILLAFVLSVATVFGDDHLTMRDPGDDLRNFIGVAIGFGIGLVMVLIGICCWSYFETFDLCARSKKEQQYSPPPETGKSED